MNCKNCGAPRESTRCAYCGTGRETRHESTGKPLTWDQVQHQYNIEWDRWKLLMGLCL